MNQHCEQQSQKSFFLVPQTLVFHLAELPETIIEREVIKGVAAVFSGRSAAIEAFYSFHTAG